MVPEKAAAPVYLARQDSRQGHVPDGSENLWPGCRA